jgi:hypothetical protein
MDQNIRRIRPAILLISGVFGVTSGISADVTDDTNRAVAEEPVRMIMSKLLGDHTAEGQVSTAKVSTKNVSRLPPFGICILPRATRVRRSTLS